MFRFTIRDVLWLTVVVALGVGWWIDRRGLVAQAVVHKREAAGYQDLVEAEYARTHGDHKVEQLQRGAEGVDRHAKAIGPAADPQPAEPPSIVTKQRAIEIVRSLALHPGQQAEIKCEEFPEEYRVFVQFYVLDEQGNRVFYPGGHALYQLDKSGGVLRTIRGL